VGNVDQRGLARTDATRTACDIGAYDTGGAVPGAASGATTTIACSVCEIPVGGKKTQLTVQAKSATGQSLTIGGDTVTLSATRGTLSAVADNGNGTYTASFASPDKKGKVIVSGTIDGQQITSTASIKVAPAAPSAQTTMITATRAKIAGAGGQTRIVVDPRDRFKNDIPTGGARIRLDATAGKLRAIRVLRNGNYAATLRRNGADDQKVVITGRINGKRIKDTAVVLFR
jgi:adhesin/invasin